MMGVAHRVMTMNAVQHVPCRMVWQHGMHKVLMTIQAGSLCYAAIAIFNLDRFRKTSGRKSQRVKQAVVGLGEIGSAATLIEGKHSQPEHGAYRAGCYHRQRLIATQLAVGRPGICVCFCCTLAAHAEFLIVEKTTVN